MEPARPSEVPSSRGAKGDADHGNLHAGSVAASAERSHETLAFKRAERMMIPMFSVRYAERTAEEILFENSHPRWAHRKPTLEHFFVDQLREEQLRQVSALLAEALRRNGGGALDIVDVREYPNEDSFLSAMESCSNPDALCFLNHGALAEMAGLSVDQF